MSKHARVVAFVQTLDTPLAGGHHPCYTGYFTCFNAGDYYEAHDVLEHLWLECSDSNHHFYKGLIQIAGAFVHLKKQHARPWHPTDGRRMQPAVRLFALGMGNISPYGPVHMDLDVASLCAMCRTWQSLIEQSAFTKNPWSPGSGPRIALITGT